MKTMFFLMTALLGSTLINPSQARASSFSDVMVALTQTKYMVSLHSIRATCNQQESLQQQVDCFNQSIVALMNENLPQQGNQACAEQNAKESGSEQSACIK